MDLSQLQLPTNPLILSSKSPQPPSHHPDLGFSARSPLRRPRHHRKSRHHHTKHKILLNRKLPPPADIFVQITGRGEVTSRVIVPRVRLDLGEEYQVVLKGKWKAVWGDSMEKIDSELLVDMTGASPGDFLSTCVFNTSDIIEYLKQLR